MHFWVDRVAEDIINKIKKEGKEEAICASGITPSGIIHVGNFREYLTVAFISKAIREKGFKVRHLHFWDDFDRFRKVPLGISKEFEEFIGKPISKIPDPWGCHSSYSQHFLLQAENEIRELGIEAEFIYQSSLYQKGFYANEIRIALENRDKIIEILNRFRKEPLDEKWYPIIIYCEKCWKDFTKILKVEGEDIFYKCEVCKYEGKTSPSKGNVKLRWRIDWPARWFKFKVDFEPGGKDHSMPGSSRDTGKYIVEEVFGFKAPLYFMYNFIFLKGEKGKMSGSKGNVVTISQLLNIYEKEVLRWLYVKTRPEKEFAIPLDETIIPTYDEFDRYEKIYFGREEEKNEKEKLNIKRSYSLAMLEIPEKIPFRLQFGFASQIAQLINFKENFEKVEELLRKTSHIKEKLSEEDKYYLFQRLEKAYFWVKHYAPENFKISFYEGKVEGLTEGFLSFLEKLANKLKTLETEEEILKETYELIKKSNLPTKETFSLLYKILINKERGPRFGTLVLLLGKEKVIERFLLLSQNKI